MEKGESVSHTVGLDYVFVTATIKVADERDVAITDLLSTYLSANMDNEEEVLMVIRPPLAYPMVLTALGVYCKFVSINTVRRKLLYVKVQEAIYSLSKSELLFYRKLWGDLHAMALK